MESSDANTGDFSSEAARRAYRADANRAWSQSKEASKLTERRRRGQIRWLRRDAVASMRLAASGPDAPLMAREDLALMLENLVLTFIEQEPGRSLDGPLVELDLLDEALAASREMVELQVGAVVELWSSSQPPHYVLRKSIQRLAALSRSRRTLVVMMRPPAAGAGSRLDASGDRGPLSEGQSGSASVPDLVAAAWELNGRVVQGNPRDTWRTRVANANAAVALLREAEALTTAASQVQQDLVYLLSGLVRTLLDCADEDPGHIAGAVAAASEAVLRQAAILAVLDPHSLTERETVDALETLATVHDDFIAAREAAGLQRDGR